VGLVWNEVSRRYVDDAPEFFTPSSWRGRPKNSKQGSDGEVHTDEEYYQRYINGCKVYYHLLLNEGVAPEQARMVLPQSMMTEWYWSGTVYAFARVCNLRCKPDTQKETQDVANVIDKLAGEAFPHCWKYLRK
jgi:thymidylate synthase (FAD)